MLPHKSYLTIAQRLCLAQVWLGPVLLLFAFSGLLYWTWRQWLDPVIDFGRELYVPWQLSEGKVLGVDIMSFYGPFSPAFNAFCFRIFGANLLTLILVNAVILAIATVFLYAIICQISTRVAAAVSGLAFLAIFGFGHLIVVGNFNFITPYSHEATHGFTLCLASLYCFCRWVRGRSVRWIVSGGVCAGLVFLTKPEFFVAIGGCLIVGVSGILWRNHNAKGAWRTAVLLTASALAPILIAFALMLHWMPWPAAGRTLLGSWLFLGNANLTQSLYYSNHMGMDDPALRFVQAGKTITWIIALLLPALFMTFALRTSRCSMRIFMFAFGVLSAAGMAVVLRPWQIWIWAGSSLLLLMPLLFGWQLTQFLRNRQTKASDNTRWLRVTVILFASLLLLKLGVNPRFEHYGFVLAGPAAALLMVAGLDWIPAWLDAKNRNGSAFRGAMFTILAGIVYAHLALSSHYMNGKIYALGEGKNAFLTDRRAAAFADTLTFLSQESQSTDTLTTLPEGALLNFLAQRASASPYVSFIPSDIAMFGEPALLASLEKGHPTYLAIIDRPTSSFGPKNFGIDYAQSIRDWAMANYIPVHLAGGAPFSEHGFGILILRRKDLPPAATK